MEFKYSQICTIKEQSERLLGLGLKKETADCFLEYVGRDNYGNNVWHPSIIVNNYRMPDYSRDFPAWSLHRLIEIAGIMAFSPVSSIDGWYDDIIAQIQSLIHIGYIDEKYLNMDIVNAKENENMELLKNVTK